MLVDTKEVIQQPFLLQMDWKILELDSQKILDFVFQRLKLFNIRLNDEK